MSLRAHPIVLPLFAVLFVACASSRAAVPTNPTPDEAPEDAKPRRARTPGVQVGGVSFYHSSLAGNLTANGEVYDPALPTCAHRSYRFGTKLRVTVLSTGRSAVCRVNDRGPFVRGRVLDVSGSLAQELGIVDAGVVRARVTRQGSR